MWRLLPELSVAELLKTLGSLAQGACYPGLRYSELVAGLDLIQGEIAAFRRGLWALQRRERQVLYHGKA